MKLYNLFLPDEIRDKLKEGKLAAGFKTEAGFSRMIFRQFFEGDQKIWTDKDLLDFARIYANRPPNSPAVLESEDKQLQKALDKFKSTK